VSTSDIVTPLAIRRTIRRTFLCPAAVSLTIMAAPSEEENTSIH